MPGCAFDTPGVSAIFVPETFRGQDPLSYIMIGDARNWRDVAFMALEDILRGQIHDSRFWSISPYVLASDAVTWTGGRAGQIRAGRIIYGMAISTYKRSQKHFKGLAI